jgi:hypothetical protein
MGVLLPPSRPFPLQYPRFHILPNLPTGVYNLLNSQTTPPLPCALSLIPPDPARDSLHNNDGCCDLAPSDAKRIAFHDLSVTYQDVAARDWLSETSDTPPLAPGLNLLINDFSLSSSPGLGSLVFRRNGQAHQESLGPPHHTHGCHLSMRRRPRGLFLAQDLLGLSHQKPRRRRQAIPYSPNYQSVIRPLRPRLGVASEATRWHRAAPKH